MIFEEALTDIKELLERFPAVCVTYSQAWPDRTDMALYVGRHDSLAAHARCCAAANTPLSVEPADDWMDQTTPPEQDEVRYILRIRHARAWIEALGVYVARELERRQLISSSERDAFRQAWSSMGD